jgi:hypothetical protein
MGHVGTVSNHRAGYHIPHTGGSQAYNKARAREREIERAREKGERESEGRESESERTDLPRPARGVGEHVRVAAAEVRKPRQPSEDVRLVPLVRVEAAWRSVGEVEVHLDTDASLIISYHIIS